MKKILYAIATFLLVSTLVFLFVTPRQKVIPNALDRNLCPPENGTFYGVGIELSEEWARILEARKRNRQLVDSLKGLSYGGGARAYMPLTEGNTTFIYSTKGNPSRVVIGPCEAELPEGDYMVTMKDGVISVAPIQTKSK